MNRYILLIIVYLVASQVYSDKKNIDKVFQSQNNLTRYKKCLYEQNQGYNLAIDCYQTEIEMLDKKINYILKPLGKKTSDEIKYNYYNYENSICNNIYKNKIKNNDEIEHECVINIKYNHLSNIKNIKPLL